LRKVPARFVTCEAAITEAQHGLENHPLAVNALRRLLDRIDVVSLVERSSSFSTKRSNGTAYGFC
jgi:predicted component of type VI protein secretion system